MRRLVAFAAFACTAFAVGCGGGDDPTAPSNPNQQAAAPQTTGPNFATATNGAGLSITTDKDDYAPGDTVWFTGAGWQPGDLLDIVLVDEPQTHEPHRWTIPVGGDGTFRDSTYVVDQTDIDVTFTLTATSRANPEQSLAVQFTDGNPQSVALNPNSRSVPQTGSAQYSIDLTMGGNSNLCTVTLSVLASPALPAGASPAITDNDPTTVNDHIVTTNASFSRTLVITTTAVTPGTYPFTVQAQRGTNCQGSGNLTVNGTLIVFGPATKLAFGQQPTNAQATQSITPAVTVRVLDANDNLVANSSAAVTLAIGANPGSGTLSGTLTQNAVDGVATFSGLSINKVGNGYTLTATSGSLASATSSPFNITLGDAAQLVFASQPSGGTPGTPFAGQPAVEVQDAGGNRKTTGAGSAASITLAIVAGTGTPGAVLTCTTNPLAATNGLATFAGCKINLSGTGYRLRATTTISGTPFAVDSDPFNIAAANQAPTVDAGTYSVAEGTELTLNPTVTDPDGDALTYKWTVNTTGIDLNGTCTFDDDTEKNAKITCTDDSQGAPGGKFTLTLEVNDGHGHTVSDDADLTVSNANPTANAGGPYSGNEGSPIQLGGSGDDPGNNDDPHLTYAWSAITTGIDGGGACTFDDATNKNAKVTCTDDSEDVTGGKFKVQLVVSDDDGGSSTASIADLTVANLAPTADAGGPYPGNEGSPIQLSGSGNDPGDNDDDDLTFLWTVDATGIDGGGACTFDDATKKDAKVTCTDDSEDVTGGKFKLKLVVSDDDGGTSAAVYADLSVANLPPTANAGGPYSGNEGTAIQLNGAGDDPGNNDDPYLTYAWTVNTAGIDAGGACTFDDATKKDAKVTCTDDSSAGTFQLKLVVSDDDGGTSTASYANLTVINAPPVITSLNLDPVAAGYVYPITAQPTVKVSFTDDGSNDTHTCRFDLKDEVLSSITSATTNAVGTNCESPLNAPAAGLYTVTVTVTDDDLGADVEKFPTGGLLIVIYDPSAGFVTGGGWINSPAGACKYAACTSLTIGKATFGFVSKYISEKDKTSPVLTGNTEFQFHAGDLNFKSSSYEWLVVNGSSGRAQYKGVGTVNGAANYGFMLTAYDGATDRFRIKIWDINTSYVIYDNQMNEPDTSTLATDLGAGSIIIHVPKK